MLLCSSFWSFWARSPLRVFVLFFTFLSVFIFWLYWQHLSFWARSPLRVFVFVFHFLLCFHFWFYWQHWSFWSRSPCRVPQIPGPVPLFTTSWVFFKKKYNILKLYWSLRERGAYRGSRVPGQVSLFSRFCFYSSSVSHPCQCPCLQFF